VGGEELAVDPAGEEAHPSGAAEVLRVGARSLDRGAVKVHADHLRGLAAGREREEPVPAVEVEKGTPSDWCEQGARGRRHDAEHRLVDLREDRRGISQPHSVCLDLEPVRSEESLEGQRLRRPLRLEVVLGAGRVEVEKGGAHAERGRPDVLGEELARPYDLGVEDAHVQDHGECPGRAADDRPVERRSEGARRGPRQPLDEESVDRNVLREVER
jgi:hypothetical protein